MVTSSTSLPEDGWTLEERRQALTLRAVKCCYISIKLGGNVVRLGSALAKRGSLSIMDVSLGGGGREGRGERGGGGGGRR